MKESIIRKNTVIGFDLSSSSLNASVGFATGGGSNDTANKKGLPRRYHSLTLKFDVNGIPATPAEMAKIVNISLEVKKTDGSEELLAPFATGKDLFLFNKTKGNHTANGFIDLHLSNWLAKTDMEQGVSALGTADISKMVFKANLQKGHGLTNPVVSLIEIYDEINEPMGVFNVIRKADVNFNSVGVHNITHNNEDLFGEGLLRSITVMKDDFSNLEVELDKERLFDVPHGDLEYIQKYMTKSQPNKLRINTSDDTFHRDFSGDSALGGIPMVGNTLKLSFTTTASVSSTVYYEFTKGTDVARDNLMQALAR